MRTVNAMLLFGAAAMVSPAQTFTTLYSFCAQSGCPDGAYPDGALLQATDGNLYGTTHSGSNISAGTIFKITTNGALTTLYDFCSPAGICPQNIGAEAPLIEATNGNLYGTTFGVAEQSVFAGSIFEITSGKVRTLHSFCTQSRCADGENPAGLVQAADGDFYGTTEFGGACGYSTGCGTVFKITPSGVLTTLYDFCKDGGSTCADGQYPLAGLVQASNGDFYGTTYFGGDHDSGTIFKITAAGALTTLDILCTGAGPCNSEPQVGLIQASNGDLYGTTISGGPAGYGTIFKLTPAGALTTVHNFCSQEACADGGTPVAPLVEGSDGNLYGSTGFFGPAGQGTIFKITPSGALTTLWGAGVTTLMQDTDGNFYGTIALGGIYGAGEVFQLSAGLAPFVKTLPPSAQSGAPVKILGSNLTGASSVTFNGTPAVFSVPSGRGIVTEISALVPAGATTGTVQVVTPGGTFSSNVPFQVLP
jgi:uncharacterized repeat protein (TIGR03803 family)